MQTTIKLIAENFIRDIWNQRRFQKLEEYLHSEFMDYSLPPGLPANKEGMRIWIAGTGKSFEHETIIEDMVSEGDKVILKIKMKLRHIGAWRGIEASGKEIETTGYRYFLFDENKIIKHWALIDGETIEKQLSVEKQSCEIIA